MSVVDRLRTCYKFLIFMKLCNLCKAPFLLVRTISWLDRIMPEKATQIYALR